MNTVTYNTGDPEPAGVIAVKDCDGDTWVKQVDGKWVTGDLYPRPWSELVDDYPPLTAQVSDAPAAPAAPREFRAYPEIPQDVTRVKSTTAVHDRVIFYKRDGDLWIDERNGQYLTLHELLDRHSIGGVVEVTESPYDVALRRLRENRDPNSASGTTVYPGRGADMDTVIRELVNENA